ncbi:MAG TPA: response regulator [Candidatus Limnocylindria bacterium]|jgi:FixJ family two-component response regulator/anti-sigma regulatory factor (Ser/Thr protein kinase)|nr:response regulator [Candidatus Limnocylindria bacterium]
MILAPLDHLTPADLLQGDEGSGRGYNQRDSPAILSGTGSPRVLVVDDDPMCQNLLEFTLSKQGYQVVLAENSDAAKRQLTSTQPVRFECVVTDYRMPEGNGLELLQWIREHDPDLATIMMTAEGERQVVADSLRVGASDFLDKPLCLETLCAAVARAIELTARQRRAGRSEAAVQGLRQAQERLLEEVDINFGVRRELCFHPKQETGGDFFNQFRVGPNQFLHLLTDVSGHDLQATYLSAYFQGVVRGLLQRAVPLPEILQTFNRILHEDLCQTEGGAGRPSGISASVAVCAILVDLDSSLATVWIQGTAAPIHWLPNGDANTVGEAGGFPLGWFPELQSYCAGQRIESGSSFCVWTDGLGDLASHLKVSELSLAWSLQRARHDGLKPAYVSLAMDDILVADLHLSDPASEAEAYRPLLVEVYAGNQAGAVDVAQAYWRRSLELALPELSDATLHDVLLASREAVLNALIHGCRAEAQLSVTFAISACRKKRTLRVCVNDPGPGHSFDIEGFEQRGIEGLVTAHRGLILMKCLAGSLSTRRNGASVTMDFAW